MGAHATVNRTDNLGWGEVTDQYMPMTGGPASPDPTVAVAARVQGPQQMVDGNPVPGAMAELLLKMDGTIAVPGFVSMAEATAMVQAASAEVAATLPPEEKVLPEGYSQVTTNNRTRITVPGGRWVEYDPAAGTFLV